MSNHNVARSDMLFNNAAIPLRVVSVCITESKEANPANVDSESGNLLATRNSVDSRHVIFALEIVIMITPHYKYGCRLACNS